MINFGWNTTGRIDKDAYRKERRRHFLFCLIPIAMFVAAGASAASLPLWASAILYFVGFILVSYYRYRFTQVMVKRLHDRNLSGKLMILSPILILLLVAAVFGYLAEIAVNKTPAPLSGDKVGIIAFIFIIPVGLFNIFLRFQMNKPGTPGPNKYGPPPGIGQALVF